MKKAIIGFGILLGIVAFVSIGYTSVSNGLFQRDMIIEKDPKATQKTSVSINEAKKIKNIEITYSNEIADDGSLIFEVKKGKELIGTFLHKPWLENKPVYYELSNGDIILGKTSLLKNNSNKIESLTSDLDIGVYDYDVTGNNVALVGMNNDGSEQIKIYVKNYIDEKTTLVDEFKYPEFQYEKATYVSWGKDGLLYYDYTLDGKPVIKVYNPTDGNTSIYKQDARNPQISPDGKFMVVYATDALDKNERKLSELQLIDLKNNTKIAELKGSRRLFWDTNHVFLHNVDESKIEIYSLTENGKKVKDIDFTDIPLEIKTSNGKVFIKSQKFDNNNIILKEDSYTM